MLTPRTVETLREERARIMKVVESIDTLLEMTGRIPVADPRKNHHEPTGNPVGRKPRYDYELGRRMYEDEDAAVKKIADTLQCTISAIKARIKKEGWKRTARKMIRESSRKSNGNQPTVKCPNCEHETSEGACEHCHQKLPTAVAGKLALLQAESGTTQK